MIDPSAKSFLSNTKKIRVAHLIEIELAGTDGVFSYLTDYQRDIRINSIDYLAGKVVNVGELRKSQGLKNYKMAIDVPAEFQDELDKVTTNQSYEGRRINVYKAYINSEGNIINLETTTGGPLFLFQGRITDVKLTDPVSGGSAKVTWECAGLLQDFEKVNGRLTDDTSHRGLVGDGISEIPVPSDGAKRPEYQTDTGFLHANQTVTANIEYLTTETAYKYDSGFLGFGADIEEYEKEVEREIDIDVSLTAKYLPVIYGVRRVQGVPVFADVLQDNPDRMVVVFAVCEGEIDSFLNVYVDGVSAMCGPGANSENAGVCMGNMAEGDTLALYSQESRESYRNTQWRKFKYDRDGRALDIVPGVNIVEPNKTREVGTSHGESINIAADKGAIKMTFYHGKGDQEPDSFMVQQAALNNFLIQNETTNYFTGDPWSSDYWAPKTTESNGAALLDTAYVVAEFDISEDRTQIPKIEFVVSGREVRVFTSPLVSTYEYTLNPVWHLLDYLTNDRFGGELDVTDFDIQSLIDVANRLDTEDTSYETSWIKMWRYLGWKDNAYSRALMQCNTLIRTNKATTKNAEDLLGQFQGSLVPYGAKYQISVENDNAPKADIKFGDLVGSIRVTNKANKKKWNSIQATIEDPAQNWSTTEVSFFNSQYLQEDNNIRKKGRAVFNQVTNYYTARSWAEYLLNASRFSKTVRVTTYYKYFYLQPNDNVTFTYERYGFTPGNNLFRVIEVVERANGLIDLELELFDESVFDLSSSGQISPPDPSDGRVSPPTSVDYLELPSEDIEVTAPAGGYYVAVFWDVPLEASKLLRYEVSVSNSDGLITVQPSNRTTVLGTEKIYGLIPVDPEGSYTVKVLAVDKNGNKSAYSTIEVNLGGLTIGTLPRVDNFDIINSTSPNTFFGADVELEWSLYSEQKADTLELEVLDPELSQSIALYSLPVTDTTFTFSYATNKAEYFSNKALLGAYRKLNFRIRAGSNSNRSEWRYLYDGSS